jgi:hypothetical protein
MPFGVDLRSGALNYPLKSFQLFLHKSDIGSARIAFLAGCSITFLNKRMSATNNLPPPIGAV